MSKSPALDALVAGFGKTVSASAKAAASRQKGECSAIGCRALVLPYALFCDRCWLLVPSDLKRIVEKHHRPGKKPSQVTPTTMAARHRWVRLREHVYICKKCGCGKVNEERRRGEWVTWFHAPDGTSTARATPECSVGEKSAIYLDKYRPVIESGGVPK